MAERADRTPPERTDRLGERPTDASLTPTNGPSSPPPTDVEVVPLQGEQSQPADSEGD